VTRIGHRSDYVLIVEGSPCLAVTQPSTGAFAHLIFLIELGARACELLTSNG